MVSIALLFSNLTATAQEFTKLYDSFEVLPGTNFTLGGFGGGPIRVNNHGQWIRRATGTQVGWPLGHAVLLNGTLLHREHTNRGFPDSLVLWRFDTAGSVGINNNGDVIILMRAYEFGNQNALRSFVLWTSGATGETHVLMESTVTPTDSITNVPAGLEEPVGAVWSQIRSIKQNDQNQFVVVGESSVANTRMMVLVDHDGNGSITQQKMFYIEGVQHDLAFPPSDGVHLAPTTYGSFFDLNNAGQVLFSVTEPGSSMFEGLHVYRDTTEVIWGSELDPVTGAPMGSLRSADMNDEGEFIGLGTNNYPRRLIRTSRGVFIREGEPMPGVDPALGLTIRRFSADLTAGTLNISNTSEITWSAEIQMPGMPAGVTTFRGQRPIIGFASPLVSGFGHPIGSSENGRYTVIGVFDGGGGASNPHLVDFGGPYPTICDGDGGDQSGCTDCPCSNNAPLGTIGGCLNSANTAARLSATGNSSVSLLSGIDIDLRFSLVGAPPLSLCILKSGDAVAPINAINPCFGMESGIRSMFYDGLRCSVTNTRRHGGRSATASGDVGLTNDAWGGDGAPPVGLAQAGGGFASGQTRYFQVITRDDPLMVCGRGLNSSQAIEVAFQP